MFLAQFLVKKNIFDVRQGFNIFPAKTLYVKELWWKPKIWEVSRVFRECPLTLFHNLFC